MATMRKRNADRELRQLFGDLIPMLARSTDPASLDLTADLMERVHAGADALLAMRGRLAEQQACIRLLPFEVRLVLCMWLMDLGMASKLIRAAYAKG